MHRQSKESKVINLLLATYTHCTRVSSQGYFCQVPFELEEVCFISTVHSARYLAMKCTSTLSVLSVALALLTMGCSPCALALLSLQTPKPRNHRYGHDAGVENTRWFFPNGYADGQPFFCGWTSTNDHISDGALSSELIQEHFKDANFTTGAGVELPYTSGEIRSTNFYGEGCFSVWMKPSFVSGMSSSFYAHSGEFDSPEYVFDTRPRHQERDIEFVGSDTRRVQTNFISRRKDALANSGTGV